MAGDDDVTAPARESSSVPSVPGPSSASAQREQSAVAAAPSPALSSTSSQTRYQPQFSASTQMILQKIRGETSNYNKAISSASASGAFQQAAYEDTKRRLAQSMNMSSSLTMPLPPPIASGSGSSRAPVRFMGDSLNTKLSGTSETPKTAPLRGTAKVAAKRGGRAAKGTKRRKTGDDEAVSAGGSDASEDEGDGLSQEAVHTMTKSGRQVSKPTQFNPAAVSSASKRKHYGKRTPEQALCKVCTRGLSPPKNQIVFCDGCNFCWHQLCHDPFIDDEFVSDEARSWFCRACTAKREKHLAKKKSVSDFKGASWANKTVEQVRSHQQPLVRVTFLTALPAARILGKPTPRESGESHHVQPRAAPRPSIVSRARIGCGGQTGGPECRRQLCQRRLSESRAQCSRPNKLHSAVYCSQPAQVPRQERHAAKRRRDRRLVGLRAAGLAETGPGRVSKFGAERGRLPGQ